MLNVQRAECTYVVPRSSHAVDLRSRADRVLRERVPEVLPVLAGEAFHDPAVWLVERIDVDFAFAADVLDDDALARLWSAEILRGLFAAVGKDEGILRFPSRAAFIAQYVSDLASGRAAGRWYYAQFASLAALPSESAIREVIARDPAIAFDVLTELARMRRLSAVIAALSPRGRREVWEVAFPEADQSTEPSRALMIALLCVWDEDECGTERDSALTGLRLAAAVLEREHIAVTAGQLRMHIDALLAFGEIFERAAEPWPEGLLDRHRLPETIRGFLARFGAAHPEVLTCAAGTLHDVSRRAGSVSRDRAAFLDREADLVSTRFAALALLLPVLADLDVLRAEEAAPLRALVAARCAGVRDALSDPIVQLFAGDEVDDMPDDSRLDLTATLTAIAVMKSFAARLPGFARSSSAHLRANFLDGAGAIRVDGARVDVHLPPLPLALVLRIAGMHGQSFTLPWLPGRTVTLRLAEAS